MQTDFAFLSASRDELIEIHRALLTRFMITNVLRQEQGLELIDCPSILEKIERLVGINPDSAFPMFRRVEEELWEYSWYAYTDEWAWFRARQDVIQELGGNNGLTSEEFDALVGKQYETHFEKYAAEIDMHEEAKAKKIKSKKKTRNKRKI